MYTLQKESKKAALLDLVIEAKVGNLFTGDNVPERLEASGVFYLDGFFYIIFDNLRQIAKIKNSLADIQDNCFVSVERENEEAFEDITYSNSQQKFYLIIESLEKKPGIYQAKIEEYDRNFSFLESKWVEFTFESENKGFEGLECIERNGNEYLLAMCEGNKCKGGKEGRKPGGGRIQVLQKEANVWEKIATIKLPKSVEFEDYSAISLENNRLAVVSQTTAKLWIGTFQDNGWDFVDDGVIYTFPTNDRGEIMYCNVEGVCWLDRDRIVVVSDKCKSSKQPVRCRHKDQSIHIFNIPNNQSQGLTISSETVKNSLSKSFKKTDYGMNFGQYLGNRVEVNDLPSEVKQAYSFYKENVENADWGSVAVYQTHIDTVPIYAVYTSTDGDDGYLEIYSQSGKEIACGRHDANAINWSNRTTVRGGING